MAFIDPLLGAKLTFILGITNVISILLVLFSCRCLIGTAFVKRMWDTHEWYKKFYNAHCIYWRIFIASVLLHTILAFLIFGNPFF